MLLQTYELDPLPIPPNALDLEEMKKRLNALVTTSPQLPMSASAKEELKGLLVRALDSHGDTYSL